MAAPMTSPRCSVILPTYNRVETLPRAVESVLAQDEPDFELIIVDDASTDGTQAWLAAQTDPRIRVERLERNQGPSAARNRGIAMARAPALAFLDSDDLFLPGRLSAPLAAFARDPAVVCALSSSRRQNKKGEMRLSLLPDVTLTPTVFEFAMICDLVRVECVGTTVRTEQARAVGGFCERLRRNEDREFLIRVARTGGLRALPDVLFETYLSADSLSNDFAGVGRDMLSFFRERPEFLRRHRKVGHYLATGLLMRHLRRRDVRALRDDWRLFRAAGALDAGLVTLWRDHFEVKHLRRAYASAEALAKLDGPPEGWSQ